MFRRATLPLRVTRRCPPPSSLGCRRPRRSSTSPLRSPRAGLDSGSTRLPVSTGRSSARTRGADSEADFPQPWTNFDAKRLTPCVARWARPRAQAEPWLTCVSVTMRLRGKPWKQGLRSFVRNTALPKSTRTPFRPRNFCVDLIYPQTKNRACCFTGTALLGVLTARRSGCSSRRNRFRTGLKRSTCVVTGTSRRASRAKCARGRYPRWKSTEC